jgi:hypothetical protein
VSPSDLPAVTHHIAFELHDSARALLLASLQATASTEPRLLPRADCDALALRFADRQLLPIAPTVAYAIGTGFILIQPTSGELTLLIVSNSLEVLERSTAFQ